jgi:non-homologous end joining protein Ku
MRGVEAISSCADSFHAPPAQQQAQVINLMDALRQSVAMEGKAEKQPERPPKKLTHTAQASKKRKSY